MTDLPPAGAAPTLLSLAEDMEVEARVLEGCVFNLMWLGAVRDEAWILRPARA